MYEKTEPLWLNVYKKIKYDITNSKYKEGDYLPNELELTSIYNVSRITVRTALAKLADDGLIKRIKGKGTVVQRGKIGEPLLKIRGFTQEMKQNGLIPGTDYAKYEQKTVSGYVAEIFGVNLSKKFNVIERVRSINGTTVGYFVTYITPDATLPHDSSLYYGSLYELLEEKGIVVDSVTQTISAEIADKTTVKMLGLVKGEAIMVMKRFGYMNGKLVEYSICKYDGKRYEYKMEMKG